ncbi:hypothetical protein B0H13DRAFT_2302038 [Mycena leptocephala]|nr:hypothetical protein B0H13DRAFT_2302038 [Mycena leptocephala]
MADGDESDIHLEEEEECYDSEYTLQELSDYSLYEDDVRCFHMCDDDDDVPPLREVENSDDEESDSVSEFYPTELEDYETELHSEYTDCSEKAVPHKPLKGKRILTPAEMGLFGRRMWMDLREKWLIVCWPHMMRKQFWSILQLDARE